MNNFKNSIETIKDVKVLEAKNIKTKVEHKLVKGLIQSIDTVLVLCVMSICVTLSVTRVGLVVVPITSDVCAGI